MGFENLKVWTRAKEFFKEIYFAFSDAKDYYFKNQICRASLSIVNNIAEGYERQTPKEFRQFLFIAKGSCGEVRSMLILAQELDLIPVSKAKLLIEKACEISKMIFGLIKSIDKK